MKLYQWKTQPTSHNFDFRSFSISFQFLKIVLKNFSSIHLIHFIFLSLYWSLYICVFVQFHTLENVKNNVSNIDAVLCVSRNLFFAVCLLITQRIIHVKHKDLNLYVFKPIVRFFFLRNSSPKTQTAFLFLERSPLKIHIFFLYFTP